MATPSDPHPAWPVLRVGYGLTILVAAVGWLAGWMSPGLAAALVLVAGTGLVVFWSERRPRR